MSDQNKFKPAFLILLLSLISGSGIFAQRYPVRTFTEADGLASSMVFDIKQDSSGLIWIARRSGISSYDGRNFKNFNVSNGLISASYSLLNIDAKDKIWAVVESGELVLSTFIDGRWKSIASNLGLTSGYTVTYSSVDVIYQNNEPLILIGSDRDGLFTFQDGRWKQFRTTDGLPSNKINSILQFEGKIFVATDKGLSVFKNNSFLNTLMTGSPFLSKNILAMAVEGNVLWLLGDNWLGFLCQGKFTLTSTNIELPGEGYGRRFFLQPDRMGRVYFGNQFKVSCYDKQTGSIEILNRNNGLINEGGCSILVDRELNTWIGSYRGITRIQTRRFASFYAIDGLFSNEVASGLEDSPGHYVFGHEGVLTFYDGKSFSTFVLDPSPNPGGFESRVMDISRDSFGNLWVALNCAGLARIDRNKKIRWYKAAQGLEGISFSVLATSDGKVYAGSNTGLFELAGDRFVKLNYPEIHGSTIRKLFPGFENSIFIATVSQGIFELRNGKISNYKSHENPLSNNIFSFINDSKNRKWVGTSDGLYVIHDSALVKANNGSLNITRPVYLILEDNIGRLWFGTDNGIYRWNEKTLDHFSTLEGISGQEMNRSAGFMDFRHRLWFGTNNGLTVYDPALDYTPNQIPSPILDLLYVESGNDTLNPQHLHEFPFSRNNLTFHFRGISFIDEKQVVYQYRLEGLDTAWSDEVFYLNNSVRYNNLKPGTYRFCVKARNSLGIWSKSVCSADVRIHQPFWFQWWFITIILLVLGGIFFLIGRYTFIIRYNARLETMVLLRTSELERSEKMLKLSNQAKDDFFSIIAHDLKSPFNSILGLTNVLIDDYQMFDEKEIEHTLRTIKRSSENAFELLENLLLWARSQTGQITFNPQEFNLHSAIEENIALVEVQAARKKIRIVSSCKEDCPVFGDEQMIQTVLRNLISNAIKFTPHGGEITVSVTKIDNHYEISVKDTGVGIASKNIQKLFKIESKYSTSGTANEKGTGLGLILCKEFVEKNGGEIRVTSEEGAGSTFYFTLPLYKPT